MMTPIEGEQAAQKVLQAAEDQYQRAIDALNNLINEVDAGQAARVKELKGVLQDLGKATQTAFDERAKVEKRIKTETGAVHGYALDLERARAEIGRRLACLGDAAAAAEVSERAE